MMQYVYLWYNNLYLLDAVCVEAVCGGRQSGVAHGNRGICGAGAGGAHQPHEHHIQK